MDAKFINSFAHNNNKSTANFKLLGVHTDSLSEC